MLDVAELRRPACYPDAPNDVAVLQTHISIVCLAGALVYKLKKPVTLPFLDFGTAERREHYCREELRLNRRLCPWVYLDVVRLCRSGDGLNFRGEGEVVDHAVLMRRLPAERMLDRLLAEDAVTPRDVARLAEIVARFHREAERGPRVLAAGGPERLAALVRANFEEMRPGVGSLFDPGLHGALAALAEADLARTLPLLRRRSAAGFVVDGHGDLHARNVCMTDPPAIYDCLEFSEAFRCSDVATEVAFMAMDLRYRGHRALAHGFVAAYAAASGDGEIPGLMPPLVRYRALVRAKVAAMASRDAEIGDDDRAGAAESARRHVRLAAATALDAERRWIVASGPPASGKSALLEALARETGWLILQSDRIRKELWGVAPTDRLPPAAYAGPVSARTYRELLARATRTEGPVLLDATWPTRALRRPLFDAASRAGARVSLVHLDVPPAIARERLARRATDPDAVSDADMAVYERLAPRFEPPRDDEGPVLRLAGDTPTTAQLDRLLAWLLTDLQRA